MTSTPRTSFWVLSIGLLVLWSSAFVPAVGAQIDGQEAGPYRVDVDLNGDAHIPDPATLPAPTPIGEADGHNPYGKSTLVVAIAYETPASPDRTDEVQWAIEYWEENAERYVGYSVEYELDPASDEPDIVIEFRDTIASCGTNEGGNIVGCAPVVQRIAPATVSVVIDVDLSNSESETTIAHELGHTLGLTHDDEPQDLMRPYL